MEGALIILAITAAFGLVLYIFHTAGERRKKGGGAVSAEDAPGNAPSQECCGMHITCEKDSLLQGVSAEIVYYDDEELDAYKVTAADGYSDAQIEEFRDVLLTLLPEDIAGWARSLQMRGITLPEAVKEELLLLVREERYKNGL